MEDSPHAPSEESPQPSPSQSHTGSPTDFLKGVVGKRVIVRLISGVDYKGTIELDNLHVTDLLGIRNFIMP